MSDLSHLAVRYEAAGKQSLAAATSALADVRVVSSVEADEVRVQPVGGGPEARVRVAAGILVGIGDEVIVQRVAGAWVVTAVLSGTGLAGVTLRGDPVLVPPFVRDATGLTNTWDSTTGVDFASLRTVVKNLDPGLTYHVEADAGAYLTAAAGTTRLRLGVRIGFASDPGSAGAWGAGHRATVPTWTVATHERVVSGVTEMAVAGRAIASAAGAQTIGDGQITVRITPLITLGGA